MNTTPTTQGSTHQITARANEVGYKGLLRGHKPLLDLLLAGPLPDRVRGPTRSISPKSCSLSDGLSEGKCRKARSVGANFHQSSPIIHCRKKTRICESTEPLRRAANGHHSSARRSAQMPSAASVKLIPPHCNRASLMKTLDEPSAWVTMDFKRHLCYEIDCGARAAHRPSHSSNDGVHVNQTGLQSPIGNGYQFWSHSSKNLWLQLSHHLKPIPRRVEGWH